MGNIMLYISVFKAFLALIRQAVDTMNEQFPEKGMGSTKLQMAIQMVDIGLKKVEGAEHFIEELTPAISPLISAAADGLKASKAAQASQ